ncbi:flavin reductase family protein [Streptomyces olivaceiscleroticus]|uniref:Pyrimidine utilization flavin reductase protein F n=1 Tax=Streptomyces olivaceiscleroticus TaxID=68245 RepID=A0ABN1AIF0_9ACTN
MSSNAVVAGDSFRDFMSRFPTGVAVVSTTDQSGNPMGMTCSSLTSVCISPPTLLVCLQTEGATFQAVRQQGTFAVNLLRDEGRKAAGVFSSPIRNKFAQVSWRWSASRLPWLDDAMAVADCRVRDVVSVGDHTVVFGEVFDIAMDEGEPLLYGMRMLFSAGGARTPVEVRS